MYYFNTKYVVKKTTTSNQLISVVELLSFQINKVHMHLVSNKLNLNQI